TDEGSGAHAEGDHADSRVPGILGLVASGTTIGALVGQVYWNYHYRKKIKARQLAIKKEVEEILDELDSNTDDTAAQGKLAELIGKRATREFMQLWQSSHVIASRPSTGG